MIILGCVQRPETATDDDKPVRLGQAGFCSHWCSGNTRRRIRIMSTILHLRTVNVAISAEESGVEFANAPADIQAVFLIGFQGALECWGATQSWPMQCRFITDEMPKERKPLLASVLRTLLEHLEEEQHYHVNRGDGSDTCKECGNDLRHEIHKRLPVTKHPAGCPCKECVCTKM